MKNKFFYYSFIFLSIFMAGCRTKQLLNLQSGQKEENYPKTPAVTLNLTYCGQDVIWMSTLQSLANDFMRKYPSIHLELDSCTEGVYMEYLKTKEALGEFPDIMEVKEVNSFIKADKFSEIPEQINQLVDSPVTYNNIAYAVPIYSTTYGIIYNKKLFEQFQLEIPKTYSDFLTICSILKNQKITPIGFGGNDLWHWNYWINFFFHMDVQAKEADWKEKKMKNQVSFTNDEMITMLKDFKYLFDQKYIQENYLITTDSQTAPLLSKGDIAMLYCAPFLFEQLHTKNIELDNEFGWFFLPDKTGNIDAISARESYWALSKESCLDQEKKEAATLFLTYFYEINNYRNTLKSMNALPTTKEPVLYPSIKIQRELRQDYLYAQKYNDYIGDFETPEGFRDDMYEIVRNIISGITSINQGTKELNQAWEKAATKN